MIFWLLAIVTYCCGRNSSPVYLWTGESRATLKMARHVDLRPRSAVLVSCKTIQSIKYLCAALCHSATSQRQLAVKSSVVAPGAMTHGIPVMIPNSVTAFVSSIREFLIVRKLDRHLSGIRWWCCCCWWWWYQSLTALQHQKDHTVPKQV